ncbi:MAG: DegT/DnrJ/EryC1/StrS family aminotransferase [Deferribacteraceae bacterium]|jgi:dTDP-4-amino-4,6-dideoxygalactose transaminase|nr:DegT/DnrJ/EryC1/StrS family aminotransferase [Deferribacteraceae bacterium]
MQINMLDLKRELENLGEEIYSAIGKTFEDTLFINGPRVREFENKAAQYLGVKHAIGVANGTDAIFLALLAAGVKPGDEVITTANTFFATVESTVRIGAVPVFADIDENTLNLDPARIEENITEKTRAIIPVHLFGLPCKMDEFTEIASKHDLAVIEDCAQAFGAEYNAKKTGSFGTAATFSFYPTKNLGGYGDGGLVATNNDKVAENVRMLKEHGSSKRYYHDLIGVNSRLDDIQAAVLSVKLKYLDDFNARRRRFAQRYRTRLAGVVSFQEDASGHIYHQFTVRTTNRQKVIDALTEAGIASAIFYPIPCHLQKSVQELGFPAPKLEITEKVASEVLSLPIHQYLTEDEVDTVSEVVIRALR